MNIPVTDERSTLLSRIMIMNVDIQFTSSFSSGLNSAEVTAITISIS